MINNINNIILTQFYPIVKSISKWIFSFYDIAIFVYLSKTIRKDKIKLKIRIITIENLSIFVDKIQSKYTNAANFTPNIKINDLNSSNASILQNQIVNSIYPYPYSSIWQRSHRKLVYFRSRGIYPHQKKKKHSSIIKLISYLTCTWFFTIWKIISNSYLHIFFYP